jgi:DHA3 family tetracycline resistance protein-like MFS transporter
MSLVAALKHRPFALLWSGQTISRLGDSLYRIALSWWVLEKTGSATIMGAVLIFSFAPMLLFILVGGVAVDRLPRARVMLASDLLRGLVALSVAVLAYLQALEVWHIFAASVMFGLVSAFFEPAYTAIVPQITPVELLPSANSLKSLSLQFANIVGPALGAALVQMGGTPFGFALDGFSFFIAALCLAPLTRLALAGAAEARQRNFVQDLKGGIQAVAGSPWLWVTISLAAFSNVTATGPFSVALPFLIKDDLGLGVNALGLVFSFASGGAVLAAVWLGRFRRLRQRGPLGYTALIVYGLATLAFGLPIPYAALLATGALRSAAVTVFDLIWTNSLQELVPGDLLGRVSSIDYIGSFIFLPVGFGAAGVLTDQIGAPLVFLLGGGATVLLSASGLLHPAVRRLD